jgi:hypothetical protein
MGAQRVLVTLGVLVMVYLCLNAGTIAHSDEQTLLGSVNMETHWKEMLEYGEQAESFSMTFGTKIWSTHRLP